MTLTEIEIAIHVRSLSFKKASKPRQFVVEHFSGLMPHNASDYKDKKLTATQGRFLRDLFWGGKNSIGRHIVYKLIDQDACTSSAGAAWYLENFPKIERARTTLFPDIDEVCNAQIT